MVPWSNGKIPDVILIVEIIQAVTPSLLSHNAQSSRQNQSHPALHRLSELKRRASAPARLVNDDAFEHAILSPKMVRNRWSCHKEVLTAYSPYFDSMFSHAFREANAAVIKLPHNIFTCAAVEGILCFMYAHHQGQHDAIDQVLNYARDVEEMQYMYIAADYLGISLLCEALCDKMDAVAHQWVCHCHQCQTTVPLLLEFTLDKDDDPLLVKLGQRAQRVMTNEPDRALPTFWTSRIMAQLLHHLAQSQHGQSALPSPFVTSLSRRLWKRVTKCNAIETLYACYSTTKILSNRDPLLGWSRPLHATLASAQSRATQLIARHFDFFCTQYPALTSCIDGITYSLDFLEYLLLHVLEDHMDGANAAALYQGLVRELMCRHAALHNPRVRDILRVAKNMILQFIARRLIDSEEPIHLDVLQSLMIKSLASDLDLTPRMLVTLCENTQKPKAKEGGGLSLRWLPLNIAYSHRSNVSRCSSDRTSTITRPTTPYKPPARNMFTCVFQWLPHVRRSTAPAPVTIQRTYSYGSCSTQLSTVMTTQHQSRLRRFFSRHFPFLTPTLKRYRHNNPPPLAVGKRVQLNRRPVLTVGTVAYLGSVSFAGGIWAGIELDRRVGKNDGSVDGQRYFRTSPNRGVFVRVEDVSLIM